MKSKYFLRLVMLLVFLVSLVLASNVDALPFADSPPADFFQLPWEQGLAWVAIDGLDNGTRRPLNSSHHYSVGGAIDFAPHNNMRKGEDTSRFWVTAAAGGTVVAKSFCHVKIDHNNGWTTEYQFLAHVQVKVGDTVYRNQRLGIIANGTSQPFCPGSDEPNVPHVHFMLRPTLINATLSGWQVNYLRILNRTTFTKNGQTVGLFQPLLNTLDLQIVLRGPITWDTVYTGSVDTYRYERWSLALDELTKFTLTATPTSTGLVPLIVLMDANGNEMARSPGTLTSTQPAGGYFVQIQPQVGNGFYSLLLQKNDLPLPSGPYVSTLVTPTNVNVGETALATVKLNNVPAEGYTSTEFTCTYNSTLAEVSDIAVANLFGTDPATAINGPQNGRFIVAIAGSGGNKATTSGTAFTFSLKGLQVGQTAVECKARVSKGDNVLTGIEFIPGSLSIGGGTSTPTPVVSPTAPVESPMPTSTQSPAPNTPTVPPTVCDKAQLIADVTIPDGTVLAPGAAFTKTWRLKNVGSCIWTTSYQIVFYSGEQMGAVSSAPFSNNVAVGQTVDISLNMTAPSTPGSYRGYWMFKNANGALFGIGSQANQPWWVGIVVSGATLTPGPTFTPSPAPTTFTPTVTPGEPANSPTPSITPGGATATPSPGTVYDFAANMCAATWFSGAGQLPCPGIDGDAKGFVLKINNPKLETGVVDTRPGLLTFPQNTQNGYIQGFYPPFHVQNGDRFRSTLACEFGATGCYVAFRLDYQIGADPIRTFWGPFLERYEGQHYSVDVDLSSLAGKDVKFILTVLSAGQASGDRALWVGPIISRASSVSTPTSEVTPTPTSDGLLTSTPTIPGGEWLSFTNSKYGFRFLYPQQGQIVDGGTENSTRINLPFTQGTNLSQKYLQMTVAENVNPCRSPLGTSSMPETSEVVIINGISFLKETGQDGTPGHINKWTAYSTMRENACVSLDFVLRAANPGVFTTPPPLYDEAAESLVFGQIVSTYEWLEGPVTSTPTAVQSPTATALPDGTLTGTVLASKPVTVSLYSATNNLVTSVTANPDGTFSLSAPAGSYTVAATAAGFLRAEGSATITAGSSSTKASVTLLAGDLDGNDVIDPFDALTIGMNYNAASPAEADLNNDGVINVLDLELLARHYRMTGPQDWQ